MSTRIEDYALIGDTRTAALVARDGSVDWLCLPRFDSSPPFAALLGTPDNGRFSIAPASRVRRIARAYRADTLVLETDFETEDGAIRVTDFMPPGVERPSLVRIVQGLSGRVHVHVELVIRFGYGSEIPWVRRVNRALVAVAGPDALALHTPIDMRGERFRTVADFDVSPGDHVPFTVSWFPSHERVPRGEDPFGLERQTQAWWKRWAERCTYSGAWREAVIRSLITLKALTFHPTGGMVAAPTTSLPEKLGGELNWDYRYCWLRDAAATVEALVVGGYLDEAAAWCGWLLRAIGGEPSKAQILYGVGGERDLIERQLSWLPGYEGSRPVRVGNAAIHEFQLDIYGEVMDALLRAREAGVRLPAHTWDVQRVMTEFLESAWHRPDQGMWESRGPSRHFTHSKVLAWAAFDRAIRMVEDFSLTGPVDRWRTAAEEIRREVETQGFNDRIGAFAQYYGSDRLDAALLEIPSMGFLPATHPRVRATVEAIERHLMRDGLVYRYEPEESMERLTDNEGAFLPCTLWMADALDVMGRHEDARGMFERVLSLRNDVGLLSEEYDVAAGRLVGNFPQALSHVWLVLVARNLSGGPRARRARGSA